MSFDSTFTTVLALPSAIVAVSLFATGAAACAIIAPKYEPTSQDHFRSVTNFFGKAQHNCAHKPVNVTETRLFNSQFCFSVRRACNAREDRFFVAVRLGVHIDNRRHVCVGPEHSCS